MNIVYIGSFATGTLHQMFDTCFLHVCTLIGDHVDCYKHKSTFEYLISKGEEYGFIDKVTLHTLYLCESSGKFRMLLKELLSAFINITLFLIKSKKNTVIINFNNLFALHVLNFLSSLLDRKLWIVCHGEMELFSDTAVVTGIWAKLNKLLLWDFFLKRRISSKLNFIVLGDSIYDNLRKVMPNDVMSHFISIDHPYYLDSSFTHVTKDDNSPLHLGLVGVLSPNKGLFDFMKFVENVESKGLNCKISIIGRISTHKYDEFMENHHIEVAWKFIEREELDKMINELDWVIYFYPSDSYKFIASGAVFDAIKIGIPILSYKNAYFEYVINKIKYPAVLVNSVDEMIDAIINNKNIKNVVSDKKRLFSPITIANQLRPYLSYSFISK